jgi:hypothetical protein
LSDHSDRAGCLVKSLLIQTQRRRNIAFVPFLKLHHLILRLMNRVILDDRMKSGISHWLSIPCLLISVIKSRRKSSLIGIIFKTPLNSKVDVEVAITQTGQISARGLTPNSTPTFEQSPEERRLNWDLRFSGLFLSLDNSP